MPCKAETIFNFRSRHHYYAYRIVENTESVGGKIEKKDKTKFSKLKPKNRSQSIKYNHSRSKKSLGNPILKFQGSSNKAVFLKLIYKNLQNHVFLHLCQMSSELQPSSQEKLFKKKMVYIQMQRCFQQTHLRKGQANKSSVKGLKRCIFDPDLNSSYNF